MSLPRPEGGSGAGTNAPVAGPDRWAVAILIGVALLAVAADAITKQVALSLLSDRSPVRLPGGLVYLTLTRNSGAAFSIGGQYTVVFPIAALAVLGVIGALAQRLRSLPWAVSLGLIAGGAAGNLVDRLLRAPGPMRGHVVDYISLFDDAGRVWPIFNVADAVLFCGVVLAIGLELTGRHRDGSRQVGGRDADRGATLRP